MSRLCHQYTDVRERVLDNLCPSGKTAEHAPSSVSTPSLACSLERKNSQQGDIAMSSSCSMQVSLLKWRLRWLGHVRRMDEGRIPKDILYGLISEGKRRRGRPLLHYRDVIRFDLLAAGIDLATWETSAFDRPTWRRVVTDGARRFEARRHEEEDANRAKEKRRAEEKLDLGDEFACDRCGRQCRARIGLISQGRCCVPK